MLTNLFNKSEEAVEAYLEKIKGLLQQAIFDTDTAVNAHTREI
ncbi:MAG: hypothetical protein PF694_08195 [Bacteroidetes bacterium]|jgi:hypothetical protein|nr:hypothetical protein [Bacteroidota bacterium]